MNRLIAHFSTITRHKMKVSALCFRCGLYAQGIRHDLSKYSPIEFCAGVRYYQGNRSPIDREKEVLGYSLGWLHHKDETCTIGNTGWITALKACIPSACRSTMSLRCSATA